MTYMCLLFVLCCELSTASAILNDTVFPVKILSHTQCGQLGSHHYDEQLMEALAKVANQLSTAAKATIQLPSTTMVTIQLPSTTITTIQLPTATTTTTAAQLPSTTMATIQLPTTTTTPTAAQLPSTTMATNTGNSCKAILNANSTALSGHYNITLGNGSSVKVYCDMEGTNCGGEGGWTRVAYVNMTQPGATCPQGLVEKTFTEAGTAKFCGRNATGCQGPMYSTLQLQYTQMCGRVVGYQYGNGEAFYGYNDLDATINDPYISGISITRGRAPNREHIWSYAVALSEDRKDDFSCPCQTGSTAAKPHYVDDHYHCESGTELFIPGTFYYNDPLWDQQQCGGGEGPCCTNSNMPWFLKTHNSSSTDDIEVRVCGNTQTTFQDTPLELIELFVK